MLFLLNDQLLDIAEEAETLTAELKAGLRTPTLYQAVLLGQQVIFAATSFREVHPSVPLRVAAFIALASDANAALFVRPADAASPANVAVRLASVPLTTLSRLDQYQKAGPLSVGLINGHVWSLASGASAA
jgi:hypothetical protein